MDIKIVNDSGDEVVKEELPIESKNTISAPVTAELELKAIQDVMGLDETESHRNQEKIQTLLDYAKTQTDDHSLEGLKWAIRNLELKLGTPPLAEKRINYVARYAFLAMEQKKIDREMKEFVR